MSFLFRKIYDISLKEFSNVYDLYNVNVYDMTGPRHIDYNGRRIYLELFHIYQQIGFYLQINVVSQKKINK